MTKDQVVFLIVVLLRLGVPLLIPRFPVPAIVACLVIDAADQSIFQQFTDLDLDGYQGYDKALDVYYLTIAYLSTIRNWIDPFAFRTAQFLWYYRLVGVVLFELTGVRAVLIIFPNTFEYFFIFYEAVRLWWNPGRLTRRQIIGAAAFIWIVIKLPQEWWLHIAQLDVTDFLKEDVLGVPVDTSWGDALGQNLWFVGLIAVLIGVAAFVIRTIARRAPDADWSMSFDVDAHLPATSPNPAVRPVPIVSWYVFEKVALIALVTVIFAQVIPGSGASPLQITFGVAFVVVVNAAVSQWLSGRGHSWKHVGGQFAAMLVANLLIVVVYLGVLRRSDTPIDESATAFFLLLLTLLVTLFDRFHRRRRAITNGDAGWAAEG